jgi:hypothetical protein
MTEFFTLDRSPTIPANHCTPCPTAHGHDPEAGELLRCKDFVDAEIDRGSHLYCPWRKGDCVAYPVALQWAKQYLDAGQLPPIVALGGTIYE